MAILPPPVGDEPVGEDDHVACLLLAVDDDVTEPVIVDPCHDRERTARGTRWSRAGCRSFLYVASSSFTRPTRCALRRRPRTPPARRSQLLATTGSSTRARSASVGAVAPRLRFHLFAQLPRFDLPRVSSYPRIQFLDGTDRCRPSVSKEMALVRVVGLRS